MRKPLKAENNFGHDLLKFLLCGAFQSENKNQWINGIATDVSSLKSIALRGFCTTNLLQILNSGVLILNFSIFYYKYFFEIALYAFLSSILFGIDGQNRN